MDLVSCVCYAWDILEKIPQVIVLSKLFSVFVLGQALL